MKAGIGRWLTADRIEVIIWGRPPVGLPLWHAVDVGGRAYQYLDDGREWDGRTAPLLVQLSMRASLPAGWLVRAAKANRLAASRYAHRFRCLDR